MILLDSSVLIEFFRTKSKENTFFFRSAQLENDFSISIITHYEIMSGSSHSQDKFWSDFFRALTIIPFDIDCSMQAVEIYKKLKATNTMIPMADLFIGATAKAKNLKIATLNTKHFRRIDGISLIEN